MLSGLQYNGGAISYQLPGGVTLNSDGSLHPQAQILLAALAAQVKTHDHGYAGMLMVMQSMRVLLLHGHPCDRVCTALWIILDLTADAQTHGPPLTERGGILRIWRVQVYSMCTWTGTEASQR